MSNLTLIHPKTTVKEEGREDQEVIPMRYALLVLGLVMSIGLHQGWFAVAYDGATTLMLSDEARLAIDVRCPGQSGRAGLECRSLLKRLFLSGALDPDRSLRTYCEEVKQSRWGGGHPPPPKLCVERYGGWRES